MKYGEELSYTENKKVSKLDQIEPKAADQNALLALEQIFVKKEVMSSDNITRGNSSELMIFINNKDPELAKILRRQNKI